MFTPFTRIYLFSRVYPCLLLFNRACLTYTYPRLLVFTYVNSIYLDTCVLLCLHICTYVYPCLLGYAYVYTSLPMFTPVYSFYLTLLVYLFTLACLCMFTHFYSCLPMFTLLGCLFVHFLFYFHFQDYFCVKLPNPMEFVISSHLSCLKKGSN